MNRLDDCAKTNIRPLYQTQVPKLPVSEAPHGEKILQPPRPSMRPDREKKLKMSDVLSPNHDPVKTLDVEKSTQPWLLCVLLSAVSLRNCIIGSWPWLHQTYRLIMTSREGMNSL